MFFIVLLFFIGCGNIRHLKKLEGEKIEVVEKEYGKPDSIIPISDGQLYIYKKTKNLKSAEINQGQLSLDPMVTPKVTKTEKIVFTVKNGVVKNIKREIEYVKK